MNKIHLVPSFGNYGEDIRIRMKWTPNNSSLIFRLHECLIHVISSANLIYSYTYSPTLQNQFWTYTSTLLNFLRFASYQKLLQRIWLHKQFLRKKKHKFDLTNTEL